MKKVSENVTNDLMRNIMPQIDQQIASHIEKGYQRGEFDNKIQGIRDDLDRANKKLNDEFQDQAKRAKKDLQNNSDDTQRMLSDLQRKLENAQDDNQKSLKKYINDNIDDIQAQLDKQRPKDPLDNQSLKSKLRQLEEDLQDQEIKSREIENTMQSLKSQGLNNEKVDELVQNAIADLELVRTSALNKKTEQIREENENKFEEFVDKINKKTDQLEDKLD